MVEADYTKYDQRNKDTVLGVKGHGKTLRRRYGNAYTKRRDYDYRDQVHDMIAERLVKEWEDEQLPDKEMEEESLKKQQKGKKKRVLKSKQSDEYELETTQRYMCFDYLFS